MSNDVRRPDKALLVVYSDTERDPKLAKAARQVWARIVTRTLDPTLNRRLDFSDFITINCDGSDESRRRVLRELSANDIGSCLAVGETAFNATTGLTGVGKLRGYAIQNGDHAPVVGTYGAEYVRAGKFHLARVVQTDLLKALGIARHGVHASAKPKRYISRPSPEDASTYYTEWVNAGRPPIAFDIETPWGSSNKKDEGMTFEEDESYTILMVSFAYRPYEAISLPWTPPYISYIKTILEEAPTALVWNAPFDVPRLLANDVNFGGEIVDAMIAWHWLEPSLPMGLKFVATFLCPDMDAWALTKDQDFAAYNCGDSDVLFRSFEAIRDRLKEQGRWDIFERHFLKFGKVLSKMTKRGIKVDLETRRESRAMFEREFTEVCRQAADIAPNEVRPRHPKAGYKKERAALEKAGLWVDGEMIEDEVEISEEEFEKLNAKRQKKPKKARKKQQEMNYGEPM